MRHYQLKYLLVISVALFLCLSDCRKDKPLINNTNTTQQTVIENVSYADTTVDFYSVWFTDENIGYVCGSKGTIIKTTDGGKNWNKLNSGVNGYIDGIRFTNKNTGYACDWDGNVLKTTDSGANWQVSLADYTGFNAIFFVDDSVGYVGGGTPMISKPKLFKTKDGGATWFELDSSLIPIQILSLYFINAETGYFAGFCTSQPPGNCLGQSAGKTTDGANSWTIYYLGEDYFSIYFTSAQKGYAVGGEYDVDGVLAKTTDGGNNWNTQILDSTVAFHAIYFTNDNIGYIVGSKGEILKTTDGGNNWTKLSSNTSENLWAIHFPIASTGYIVGEKGTILKVTIN